MYGIIYMFFFYCVFIHKSRHYRAVVLLLATITDKVRICGHSPRFTVSQKRSDLSSAAAMLRDLLRPLISPGSAGA